MPNALKPRRLDPGAAPHVPVHWRDFSLRDQVFFYVIAANERGRARNLTLNFTAPTMARLRHASPTLKRDLTQRFRDHLQGVPLFLFLELAPRKRRLHVHGLLDAHGHDEADLEERLRKVAGDLRKLSMFRERRFRKKYAVDLVLPDWGRSHDGHPPGKRVPEDNRFGPYGWANYAAKEVASTKRRLKLTRTPIYVSEHLRSRAMEIHTEDVAAVRAMDRLRD